MKSYSELLAMLNQVGQEAEDSRKQSRRRIRTEQDLIEFASTREGVYWIETNMPDNEIISAVKESTGKDLKVRKSKPEGKGLTSPDADGF